MGQVCLGHNQKPNRMQVDMGQYCELDWILIITPNLGDKTKLADDFDSFYIGSES